MNLSANEVDEPSWSRAAQGSSCYTRLGTKDLVCSYWQVLLRVSLSNLVTRDSSDAVGRKADFKGLVPRRALQPWLLPRQAVFRHASPCLVFE